MKTKTWMDRNGDGVAPVGGEVVTGPSGRTLAAVMEVRWWEVKDYLKMKVTLDDGTLPFDLDYTIPRAEARLVPGKVTSDFARKHQAIGTLAFTGEERLVLHVDAEGKRSIRYERPSS